MIERLEAQLPGNDIISLFTFLLPSMAAERWTQLRQKHGCPPLNFCSCLSIGKRTLMSTWYWCLWDMPAAAARASRKLRRFCMMTSGLARRGPPWCVITLLPLLSNCFVPSSIFGHNVMDFTHDYDICLRGFMYRYVCRDYLVCILRNILVHVLH